MEIKTCSWPGENRLANLYHDTEWGVPVHSDQKHFEFLLLDAFQAGLSWNTILNKRENFRAAFDDFDFVKISNYNEEKVAELMANSGIIRNKLKIEATVKNAKAFIEVIKQHGSFDAYIWELTGGKPIVNHFSQLNGVPAKTELSDKMSKELSKKGFKFVGSTICYAYMQAAGFVNDHLVTCFRHSEIQKFY